MVCPRRDYCGKVPIQTVLTFTLLLESYTQRKNVTATDAVRRVKFVAA
jgi:hypothetical protein